MMNMNNSTAAVTMRTSLHKWIDLLGEGSLPEVKMIMQQYAARELNRRHWEARQQK